MEFLTIWNSWAISNPGRWCCESAALTMLANLENSAVATGLEKISFLPIPKKGKAKECSNYRTTALTSHASKVMLKILQARLQQYVNHELSDVQAGFRKRQRKQRSNCQHSLDHGKSKRVPEKKKSTSPLLTMPKPLTMWITTNCGKFLKRWEYLFCSWEACMLVKMQQLEPYMENCLVQNWKRVPQGSILSPCLFNLYTESVLRFLSCIWFFATTWS